MNVLMVGGTGCLSSAVVAEALRRGIGVTIITRGKRKIPQGVECVVADCNDRQKIAETLADRSFDAVIDYLCYTSKQLLDSFTFYSLYTKQYIYISSCAVYDTASCKFCAEDAPKVLPIWEYSVQKWASEVLLARLASRSTCKYTVVRPCVTYGDTRIPYGISPIYGYHWTLAARVLAGKPIIRWNRGENRCMMTRVEDFAVGVVGLIGNSAATNEAFNVCGEDAPSFNDVLDAMGEALGCGVKILDVDPEFYANEIPWRKGELLGGRCIDAIMSNAKIKSVVPEFRQTIFLKEGVKKTIDAYKTQNYQSGIDWDFDAQTDRIVEKWCRLKGIPVGQYKLHFVDYLGTATREDRHRYGQVRYRDAYWMRALNFAGRVKMALRRRFLNGILRKIVGAK